MAACTRTRSTTSYDTVGFGTVGCPAKNSIKVSANVADTVRPKVADAKERPGWSALRAIAGRMTTPLLPDDAEAGRLCAVTVATNMAGRGTDIVLGGYRRLPGRYAGATTFSARMR